jgi:outer membrane protein assembly factor BamB/tetratricopeptide (TPR) repeat protein
VLVVAGRGDWSAPEAPPVQAFFAWEDIERSIAERRAKRPSDPALALEAADLWRVVGRGDKAETVYEEALRLAEAAKEEGLAARAKSGLSLVHRDRGDAALARNRAADAQAEYEAALGRAGGPAERVDLRLRLDRALTERDLESARVRNFEALAAEAGGERAVFDPKEGPVAARVGARLRLARIHRGAGRPADAVDALQRVLLEDGAERVGDETARVRAKREIDEVLADAGRGAYRRHEEEASALLEKAARQKDAVLYRRLLEDYPNAAAVPEALVGLADRRTEEGAPTEAASTLRGLLAVYPEHALAPRALAGLARALAAAGSPVAARAALASLERRHADASLTIDGRAWTGRTYAESLRASLGPRKPAPAATPLSRQPKPVLTMEVDAPPPGAQTLPVARDASATTIPPILVDTGSDLVAIDPATARVRWRRHVSSPVRAALVGDVLVVGVADAVLALDPETGDERWRRDVPGTPVGLQAGLGQAIVLAREEGISPRHRLLALDAFTSHEIWRHDLPTSDPVPLDPLFVGDEGVVVARRRRDGRMWTASLAIHSLLTGARLADVPCPTDGTTETQYALAADGRTLLLTCSEAKQPRLEGWDVGTGKRRWQRRLEGVGPRVTHVLSFGDAAILIDGVGRLATYALADGSPRHLTGIAAGLDPLFGSAIHVDAKRVTMLVRERSAATLASFDRETGKAAWSVPFAKANAGALLRSGDLFVAVIAPTSTQRAQGSADYRVHLVTADGTALLQMQSAGVGGYRPVPVLEGGTLVLAGTDAVAAWR